MISPMFVFGKLGFAKQTISEVGEHSENSSWILEKYHLI